MKQRIWQFLETIAMLYFQTYTYHKARRATKVPYGTAADELLVHNVKFKMKNIPKINLNKSKGYS